VFHLAGGRFSLDPFDRTGLAGNRLVLIGRNLDRAWLRAQLEACLTPISSPPAHSTGDASARSRSCK
jgi:hypothetical protein